jgi:tRNA dimethylallyltransferase
VNNGEIICADSRTIYKDLNIGTAKPSDYERSQVPHWGLDLILPGDYFSAADFKKYTEAKIQEIRSRGHVPFLVGGTGLYIDSVVFDYKFGELADNAKREGLNKLTLSELHDYCAKNNIKLPENAKNKRYVIRAIELNGANPKKRNEPIENLILVGMKVDKEELRSRICKRAEQLFDDGVVDEAKRLGKKYGWGSEAMKGNIYPLIHEYLLGDLTWKELKIRNSISDWKLAKRQITWMKRNVYIKWFTAAEALSYISNHLAK